MKAYTLYVGNRRLVNMYLMIFVYRHSIPSHANSTYTFTSSVHANVCQAGLLRRSEVLAEGSWVASMWLMAYFNTSVKLWLQDIWSDWCSWQSFLLSTRKQLAEQPIGSHASISSMFVVHGQRVPQHFRR